MTAGPSRTALVAKLAESVRDAALAGDLFAARIAADTLNRLLAEPAMHGTGAEIISLAERRRRE